MTGAGPDADAATAYLDYAVRWRAGHGFPGRHESRLAGAGGHFRAYRPFWQIPDARRIDVRRSAVDPFGEVMVRQTDDRAAIPVMVAADMSASMAVGGRGNLDAVARLASAAARSAHRAGDGFGLIGFDGAPRTDLYLPAGRNRGATATVLARLCTAPATGDGAQGLAALAPFLPTRRTLLILASDFLWPWDVLERGLAALAAHDLAPIVFHEPRERAFPRWGVMRLADRETGARRLFVMRPALARRWQAARADWRARLDETFLRFGRPAFHVQGELDLARLGQHLLGYK